MCWADVAAALLGWPQWAVAWERVGRPVGLEGKGKGRGMHGWASVGRWASFPFLIPGSFLISFPFD